MLALKRDEELADERPAGNQTIIGKGCIFEGKLTFEGLVRIDGQFDGEIHTQDTLLISAGAHVDADVTAGTVIVHGTLVGNVAAEKLIELHPPARVKGTLESPSLSMAKGAVFEGAVRMERRADEEQPLKQAG